MNIRVVHHFSIGYLWLFGMWKRSYSIQVISYVTLGARIPAKTRHGILTITLFFDLYLVTEHVKEEDTIILCNGVPFKHKFYWMKHNSILYCFPYHIVYL